MKYKLKVTETAYDFGVAKPALTGAQRSTLTKVRDAGAFSNCDQKIKALEILINRAKTDREFYSTCRNQLPKMEALLKALKKSA